MLVLTEQGYLHKTYNKSWKLLGKPAVYSLAAKGIKVLRDNTTWFPETVYKNQYKNRSASLQLVEHSLDVAKLCLQLRNQYGKSMEYFAKSEITKFEQFIRPLPDLYLIKSQKQNNSETIHYQLETIEAGTLTWMIRKRIHAHQEWLDDNSNEGWGFEDNYPTLLFVCDNKSTEKRIHRLVDGSSMDFETWTTTRERFNLDKKKVWVQHYDEFEDDGVMVEL